MANFWCCLNLIVKFRLYVLNETLFIASNMITVVSVLPPSMMLFSRPSPKGFLLLLFISAMSFFLFSYHVHEKTILLPLVPFLMLFHQMRPFFVLFTTTCTFSMFFLLQKDGQSVPYFVLLPAYTILSLAVLRHLKELSEAGAHFNAKMRAQMSTFLYL